MLHESVDTQGFREVNSGQLSLLHTLINAAATR